VCLFFTESSPSAHLGLSNSHSSRISFRGAGHESLKGREGINSTLWKPIKNNKDERYHFLEKVSSEVDVLEKGLPELAIDFKRYFTIPTEEVYVRLEFDAACRCRLVSPYLEHLSGRFYAFQSRVALPRDPLSE
jgi:hypothetical protein